MSSDASDPEKAQRAERLILPAEVTLRRGGDSHRFRVRVFDASSEGCKVEFIERPAIGDRIWIKFEGLEALEATVRWADGHIGGVSFEHPLHEAVFQRLASASKKGP